MHFLCDVHIPYKLVNKLHFLGHEAIHVNDILDKWNTKDKDICKYADQFGFVVITKDSDFRDSFFVNKSPKKLIKINLGNIPNNSLLEIFSKNITSIEKLKDKESFLLEI